MILMIHIGPILEQNFHPFEMLVHCCLHQWGAIVNTDRIGIGTIYNQKGNNFGVSILSEA